MLIGSAIASPIITYRGPVVLQMSAEPWFNVNMMQKDLLMALERGRQANVPLPATSAVNEFMTAARAMGHWPNRTLRLSSRCWRTCPGSRADHRRMNRGTDGVACLIGPSFVMDTYVSLLVANQFP